MTPCPCCGKPMDDNPVALVAALGLSKMERRVCRLLAANFGQWVRWQALADAVYRDDPNGGPLTADLCLRNFVFRAKKKLAAVGLTIEGSLGQGSNGRRMVRLPPLA